MTGDHPDTADQMPGAMLGPFVDLPDGPREAVRRLAYRRRFSPGQLLFSRGDVAGELMIVQSGLIAVQMIGPESRRLTVAVLGPEDTLGEMALAGAPRRTATVVALHETEVLAIDAQALSRLRTVTLELDTVVMGVLVDTVRRLTDQVLEATLLSQAVRLRVLIVRLHRYFPDGRITITQDLLAQMLGARPGRVSALLADEEERGTIARHRGYVQVLDLAALRAR